MDGARISYPWSLRILILSLAGILFLTLYPFHFDRLRLASGASPFLLEGGVGKGSTPKDVFLNVLLFMPFGFGLAGLLRAWELPPKRAIILTFLVGAAFSYAIEFTQFFSSARDSGWEDVLTNSTGAFWGAVLLVFGGISILRAGQRLETWLDKHLSIACAVLTAVLYLACWFALSAGLQRQTAIRVWNPNSQLVLAGLENRTNSTEQSDRLRELEFWNRALPDSLAGSLTAGLIESPKDGAISAYLLEGSGPFRDSHGLGPELAWQSGPTGSPGSAVGHLTSLEPATPLIQKLASAGQFAIRIRFALPPPGSRDNLVLTLAPAGTFPDLEMRQRGSWLDVWFRTALTKPPSALDWVVPFDFGIRERHDLLLCYDGSRLWAYVDGRSIAGGFRLSPSTALAATVRYPRTQELLGYRIIYYAIVFFPAGVAMALAYRKTEFAWKIVAQVAMLMIASSIALEFLLTQAGGQWVSLGNILLGFAMFAFGLLWMNSEQRFGQPERNAVSI